MDDNGLDWEWTRTEFRRVLLACTKSNTRLLTRVYLEGPLSAGRTPPSARWTHRQLLALQRSSMPEPKARQSTKRKQYRGSLRDIDDAAGAQERKRKVPVVDATPCRIGKGRVDGFC